MADLNNRFNHILSEYYYGKPNYLDETAQKQPNIRKLSELPWQLTLSSEIEGVSELLLNYPFIRAKVRAHMAEDLINDYKSIEVFNNDIGNYFNALRFVKGALNLSSGIISKDTSSLAGQLVGRLNHFKDININDLVNQIISGEREAWIDPVNANLIKPGSGISKILRGHTAWISSFSISKDNKIALTSSRDGYLKVWNITLGNEIRSIHVNNRDIAVSKITPDGRKAATGSNLSIQLWDLQTGERLNTFEGHQFPVLHLEIVNEGKILVSASEDGNIRLWDLENGTLIRSIQSHRRIINLKIDNKCKHCIFIFAINTFNNLVKAINLETGKEICSIPQDNNDIIDVGITGDGEKAVIPSYEGAVYIWDLTRGIEVKQLQCPHSKVNFISVSSDNSLVLMHFDDNTLQIWDIINYQLIHSFDSIQGRSVGSILNPNNSSLFVRDQDSIYIYNTAEIASRSDNVGHNKGVVSVFISKTGHTAASASADQVIKTWKLENFLEMKTFRSNRSDLAANPIVLSSDGKILIHAIDDNGIRCLDTDRSDELFTINEKDDSSFRAEISDLYNLPTGEITCFAISQDDRVLIGGSRDRLVLVWDLVNKTNLRMFEDYKNSISALAITANGKRIISTSGNSIKVFDLESYKELLTINNSTNSVNSVTVFEEGNLLFSASGNTITAWSLSDGKRMYSLSGHTGKINMIDAVLGLPLLISVSDDHSLKVWNIKERLLVASFYGDSKMLSCSSSSQAKYIIAGEESGRVHFLTLHNLF